MTRDYILDDSLAVYSKEDLLTIREKQEAPSGRSLPAIPQLSYTSPLPDEPDAMEQISSKLAGTVH